MRMCGDHWERLRAAVDAAGMGSLVSETGEDAARGLVSAMQDGPTVDNFDPLLGAHQAIIANCLDAVGPDAPALVAHVGCPLCLLVEQHAAGCDDPGCPVDYESWVELAVAEQVAVWKGFSA